MNAFILFQVDGAHVKAVSDRRHDVFPRVGARHVGDTPRQPDGQALGRDVHHVRRRRLAEPHRRKALDIPSKVVHSLLFYCLYRLLTEIDQSAVS